MPQALTTTNARMDQQNSEGWTALNLIMQSLGKEGKVSVAVAKLLIDGAHQSH